MGPVIDFAVAFLQDGFAKAVRALGSNPVLAETVATEGRVAEMAGKL
jgi:hypothetical protein